MVFTCIARECEGQPIVYAYARRLPETTRPDAPRFCSTVEDAYDRRQILQPMTAAPDDHIAFAATTAWSGCRAMDAPILAACAEHEGIGYRFATRLASGGCNFGPELSEQRFIELIDGVRPALGPK